MGGNWKREQGKEQEPYLYVSLFCGAKVEVRKVGKRVATEQRNLKEEHGCSPYRWGTAENRKQHFGCHRLDKEQQG